MGTWTYTFAERILMILHENNRKTYERVKKLSFVSMQSENIFAFNKSIQKILSAHLKNTEKNFVIETRKSADKFLHSIFYDGKYKYHGRRKNFVFQILLRNYFADN